MMLRAKRVEGSVRCIGFSWDIWKISKGARVNDVMKNISISKDGRAQDQEVEYCLCDRCSGTGVVVKGLLSS